jgi:hypothetical protein
MCQDHIYKVLKWKKLSLNLHTKNIPFFKISKPKI